MGFVGLLAAIVQGGLIRIVIPKFGAVRCATVGLFVPLPLTQALRSPLTPCLFTLGAWCLLSQVCPVLRLQASCLTSCRKTIQGELQGVMASAMSLASIIGPLLMTQTFTYFTSPQAPIYLPSAFIIAAILTVVALAIFLQQVRKLPPDTLHTQPNKATADG